MTSRNSPNIRAKLEEQILLHHSHLDRGDQATGGGTHSPGLQLKLEAEKSEKEELQQQVKKIQSATSNLEEELAGAQHRNKSLQLMVEESVSKQALDQLTKRHQEEMELLSKKSSHAAKTAKQLDHISERLKSRNAEVAALKEEVASLEEAKLKAATKRAAPATGGQAKNARRVQELEKQVKELERVIQKRFPNSLAALVMAASSPNQDALAKSAARVEELGSELRGHQQGMEEMERRNARKYEALQQEYATLKGKYEKQEVLLRERGTSWGVPGCRCRGYPESSLPPQTDALPPSRARSHSPRSHHREEEEEEAIAPCTIRNSSASSGPHGASGGRRTDALTSMSQLSDVVCENTKLKQQLSELTFELEYQRVQWQGKLAEAERKAAVLEEEAQKKVALMEEAGQKKLDFLVARLATERSHSDIISLQSRLQAREATIAHLKEVIECLEYDSKQVSACKAREVELVQEVKTLTEKLMEAEKNHTPEMHQFVTLKSRIRVLEERCSELSSKYRLNGQSSSTTDADIRELEHKWRCKLVAKNAEIEKYREEVDSLLAALRVLQQSGHV